MDRITGFDSRDRDGAKRAPTNGARVVSRQVVPMANSPSAEESERDLTIHVFTISASMVGVCLTAIGILRLITSQTRTETIGDDLLAADAVVFMVCCFLSFWSFKTKAMRLRHILRFIVDSLFMLGLTIMVLVCAVIAYAIV